MGSRETKESEMAPHLNYLTMDSFSRKNPVLRNAKEVLPQKGFCWASAIINSIGHINREKHIRDLIIIYEQHLTQLMTLASEGFLSDSDFLSSLLKGEANLPFDPAHSGIRRDLIYPVPNAAFNQILRNYFNFELQVPREFLSLEYPEIFYKVKEDSMYLVEMIVKHPQGYSNHIVPIVRTENLVYFYEPQSEIPISIPLMQISNAPIYTHESEQFFINQCSLPLEVVSTSLE